MLPPCFLLTCALLTTSLHSKAYSLIRREEELDGDGPDNAHYNMPPTSWTPLQLWRALTFIVSSGNNEVSPGDRFRV